MLPTKLEMLRKVELTTYKSGIVIVQIAWLQLD